MRTIEIDAGHCETVEHAWREACQPAGLAPKSTSREVGLSRSLMRKASWVSGPQISGHALKCAQRDQSSSLIANAAQTLGAARMDEISKASRQPYSRRGVGCYCGNWWLSRHLRKFVQVPAIGICMRCCAHQASMDSSRNRCLAIGCGYTVGHAQLGRPELLMCELEPGDCNTMLPPLSQAYIEGHLDNKSFRTRAISNKEAKAVAPFAFILSPDLPVKVSQLVFPDLNGKFPWQKGVSPELALLQARYWE